MIASHAFALTLLVLAACGGDQQGPRAGAGRAELTGETVAVVEAVPPRFTLPLRADDGTLLSVRDVIATDRALLILDGSSGEIWQLELPGSTTPASPPALHRISRPRQFAQGDVFAMAAHPAGLSVIGIDGALRVMERADADRLAYIIRAFRPIHRPLALGEWTDGRWVAVHAVVVLQGAPVDSVLVTAVDSAGRVARVFGLERTGPSRPDAFVVDPISARALRGRLVLVGADPARVLSLSPTGSTVDTLLDPPRRELGPAERSGIERMRTDPRTPDAIRASRPPRQRPAALAALPFAFGYLVVAQGGEEARFLDLYCGRTFRRTLLSRAGLNDLFVVDGGIVAVDEPPRDAPDRPLVLSFYRSQDFHAECAE
ncbi:MAG: hypothetical protein IPJ78_01510 [Gemmatimonadetes bacterium]|nr:hypothetical protein [Gemmatimonadota bacterium]